MQFNSATEKPRVDHTEDPEARKHIFRVMSKAFIPGNLMALDLYFWDHTPWRSYGKEQLVPSCTFDAPYRLEGLF